VVEILDPTQIQPRGMTVQSEKASRSITRTIQVAAIGCRRAAGGSLIRVIVRRTT
jgi:hypothetical protein